MNYLVSEDNAPAEKSRVKHVLDVQVKIAIESRVQYSLTCAAHTGATCGYWALEMGPECRSSSIFIFKNKKQHSSQLLKSFQVCMEQFEDGNALLLLTILSNPNIGQGLVMKFNVQTESYYECKKKKIC